MKSHPPRPGSARAFAFLLLGLTLGSLVALPKASAQSPSRATARACFSRALHSSPILNANEAAFLCRGAPTSDGPLHCLNYGLSHILNLDRVGLICLCAGAEDEEPLQCYLDAIEHTPGLSAQAAVMLCSSRCGAF